MLDHERYRAVCSRDPRFDGWFVTAVLSTGIYCRPSCPARAPRRANVRFYKSSAAAHGDGFRACKRCRPDASPGSPEWNVRSDVVARAMRLIADGALDRQGVGALAARLGYSQRQLHRVLMAELGVGAMALARAQRAQTARLLLETTALTVTEVAFAAGFASLRQFNDTVRAVFAMTPTDLRSARRGRRPQAGPGRGASERRNGCDPFPGGPTGTIGLRLAYRSPLAATELFGFLGARAVPGVEGGDERSYRRTLALPHGHGTVRLEAMVGHVRATVRLDDLRDLSAAVQRARRLLDLDADPEAIDEQLGDDPLLGPLVAARPGLRAPGHVDPAELAVRAVLGQQVSVAGARTVAGRLVASYGERLAAPVEGLTHLFPAPARLAAVDPGELPMPRARARALVGLAQALADGVLTLDAGSDPDETTARLLCLAGIGPWTAGYVRLRGLGDPDVFLPTDLGVVRAIEARVGAGGPARRSPGPALVDPARWRPWRSYALHHLWRAYGAESPPATATATATATSTATSTPAPTPAPAQPST